MKGLRKYLTPFAPDQSGAVAMCYALGGMVVIVDAGGCAGNICGFDEPRWQPDYMKDGAADRKAVPGVAAVFSAGLRDMDAILGRDDLLVQKLADASKKIDAKFIALVGTPVPAVIGTDLQAVSAMARRAAGLPCIAVSTDGMHLYDRGIEQALLALLEEFALEKPEAESLSEEKGSRAEKICGILGLNPLDLFDPGWTQAIRDSLLAEGYQEVLLHGMEGGLDTLRRSGLARINYVVSPAGIAAAEYLKKRFGTPYEISFPADPMLLLEEDPRKLECITDPDAKILVVHQQVLAHSVRMALRKAGAKGTIVCATWFEQNVSLSEEQDVKLFEEDDFVSLCREGKWNLIIADPTLRPMAGDDQGKWIDAFHFAVSGQAAIDQSRNTGRKL